jgi:S1-C subfamily serine protease
VERVIKAEGDRLLIDMMGEYKKGTLSFATEAMKNEYLRKMEALENEYSIHDPEALKEASWKNRLKYSRQQMMYCSGIASENMQAATLGDIGEALTELKQPEDAIPVLQRCVALKPDFAFCWLGLGKANESLRRIPEAKFFYKKAIETGGFDELNAVVISRAKVSLALLEIRDAGKTRLDFLACSTSDPDFLACVERHLDQSASGDGGNPATTHIFSTGFAVSRDGAVLTNNHVVAGCRNLRTRDGRPLRVIGRNAGSDLALLKADLAPHAVAVFRTGPTPKLGDAVVAFGFPLPGILSSEGNVSTGVLSATSGLDNDIRFVQISAPVQPGNSGGPLFDSSGHVIGVVVAKLDALRVARATGDIPQNVNFAVHWSEVQAFLDEQGIQYRKEPSQRGSSTRDIAATATQIAVAIDCTE